MRVDNEEEGLKLEKIKDSLEVGKISYGVISKSLKLEKVKVENWICM